MVDPAPFKPVLRKPVAPLALGALIIAVSTLQLMQSLPVQEALAREYGVVPARFAEGGFSSPLEMLAPLVGHAFLHGFWLHLGMNMLIYFQIAGPLGWRLSDTGGGNWRFLAFFAGSAMAGALAYIVLNPHSDRPAIGASGAICGLFAGYLLGARRNWRDAVADPQIRRAAFWFLAINVGLMWFLATNANFPIAWEAHLGGFLGGVALFPLLAPRRRIWTGPWG
jgi:membrane associated rhomboid family serine protease